MVLIGDLSIVPATHGSGQPEHALNDTDPNRKPSPSRPIQPEPATRAVSSEQLFAGAREVEINHNGRIYRLRITQNGKLILNA